MQSFEDNPVPIAWQGETMLLRWNESSSGGRTVTLQLPDDGDDHPFKPFTIKNGKVAGQRFMAVFVQVGDDENPVTQDGERKPYGMFAKELHRIGWFFLPKVINAIGGDRLYSDWVVHQPCCICGNQAFVAKSGVPLCRSHKSVHPAQVAGFHPKLLKEWVSRVICEELGFDSIGYIPPKILYGWARNRSIHETLPAIYRAQQHLPP